MRHYSKSSVLTGISVLLIPQEIYYIYIILWCKYKKLILKIAQKIVMKKLI